MPQAHLQCEAIAPLGGEAGHALRLPAPCPCSPSLDLPSVFLWASVPTLHLASVLLPFLEVGTGWLCMGRSKVRLGKRRHVALSGGGCGVKGQAQRGRWPPRPGLRRGVHHRLLLVSSLSPLQVSAGQTLRIVLRPVSFIERAVLLASGAVVLASPVTCGRTARAGVRWASPSAARPACRRSVRLCSAALCNWVSASGLLLFPLSVSLNYFMSSFFYGLLTSLCPLPC